MTETEMALATGCDCPAYPAEVERDCCCIGGTECMDVQAPSPSRAEKGAVSAIADHSVIGAPAKRASPSTIDPTVEAAGAAQPYYRAGPVR